MIINTNDMKLIITSILILILNYSSVNAQMNYTGEIITYSDTTDKVKSIPIMLLDINKYNVDLDTCFTKDEIKNIYYKIKKLELINTINDSIIYQYNNQYNDIRQFIKNDSLKTNSYIQTINLLNEKNDVLKKTINELEPKWYNDKTIWFGLGVALTLFAYNIN